MNVLVVGHQPQTRQLVQVLRTVNRASATHYRCGAEAIAATRHGGFNYDLVFLEDGEGSPDSQAVADAIQTVDALTPIAFLRYPEGSRVDPPAWSEPSSIPPEGCDSSNAGSPDLLRNSARAPFLLRRRSCLSTTPLAGAKTASMGDRLAEGYSHAV